MKELVRVACNNNFNCTPKEWIQLDAFSKENPDKVFFINSNIKTPKLDTIKDHPYKVVITINPDLLINQTYLTKLFKLPKSKIAFVRLKWLPLDMSIWNTLTLLFDKGYKVVITLQRFNSLKTLTEYTDPKYYKFDCSRYRLTGKGLQHIKTLVKALNALDNVSGLLKAYKALKSYKQTIKPVYICDEKGLGCEGCKQCALLTINDPTAKITSLNLSTSGICPYNCPDCYAKTMQNFLKGCGKNPIHYDRIAPNRKQAGYTKHIKNAQQKDDCATDPRYWDCECKTNYIHKKSTKKYCSKCDTYAMDQPDSRVKEIK
jgi:hypothetical protein